MTFQSRLVLWVTVVCLSGGLRVGCGVQAGEIHDAIRINDLATVKSLLANDSKLINSRDDDRVTPLHEAVRYGDAELVRFLIEQGADVNSRCYNDFTPLHLTSDPEVARILVQSGADLHAGSNDETPLRRAVSDENMELIDFYVSAGCRLTFEDLVALGRVDEVAQALQSEPWLAKAPRKCLHAAAARGDVPMVRLLLTHGADPNGDYGFSNVSGTYSPLSAAVLSNRYEVAELLCQHGARMDVAGGKFYDNLFHEAVAEQDIRLVRLMLEHGADVNAAQGAFHPMSPLHVAANIGDVEKCKLLLEFKADVNAHTPDGATPLDFAAVWDHRAICELLLAHGADLGMQAACALGRTEDIARILNANPQSVNQRDNRLRRTPLHWAAASGHRGLVAVLIRAGADVNAKAPRYGQAGNVVTGPETWGADEAEDAGETPLHVAARAGHAPVAELLVQNGADVNASDENQMTVLQHAVYAGQVAVVQLLLEHGAKVDVGDGSCLPAAYDNVAITELLLARNPGQASLNQALSNAASDNPQVAALLLAAGAQADIFAAASLGLNDRIAELLDADPKLVNREQTEYPYGRPLPLAAKNGHVEAVKLLLARQADVEPEDATVPLQAAAAGDYLEIMDLLAEHGADVNHKDGMGGSALQAAAEAGHVRAVKWLMEHGADPLIRDVYQATPLHAAARSGAAAVVRLLIEAGVPVDSRDDFRETPLHEAADDGQMETAELLLQLGADVNARNRRGQTPLSYAERERHPRFDILDHNDRRPVAAMLRSSGGIK